MSGGGVQTYRLSNGGFADVPDDVAEQWAQRMESRGIKFEPAPPSADMQVGEPQAIYGDSSLEIGEPVITGRRPASRGASGSWDDVPAPRGALDVFLEGAGDAVRGANQGLYLGGADEVGASARVAQGQPWQSAIDQERGDMRAAQARSPWLFEGGRALGSVPGAMVGGLRALLPTGIAGGALSSDSDDWRETIGDAAGGGAIAAGLGAAGRAIPAAAGWVGDKARGVGEWLGEKSTQTRNAALGGTPGQFQTLAREKGLDYAEGGLGEAVERQGLTNRFWPQSAGAYARKADAKMTQEVAAKDAALAAAGNELDPQFLPRQDLTSAIGARAGKLPDGRRDPSLESGPMAGNYQRLAANAEEVLPEHMSPAQLDRYKMDMYDKGYTADKVAGTPEGMAAQAHQGAGRIAKDQLHDALNYALPETRDAFMGANQNIGELATIGNMSRDAAGKQAAQRSQFLPNLVGGAVGGGAFATSHDPFTSAALGYGATKAMNAARELGPDFSANMQALGRDAAGSIGAGAGSLAQAALDTLQAKPSALGGYANLIAQAAVSPDRDAVQALVTRLAQEDPQFRRDVLPMLQGAAGGM